MISADTEYPELCMRFADMLFNNQTDSCRPILNGVALEPYNYEGYYLGTWNVERNGIDSKPSLPEGLSSTQNINTYIAGTQWSVGAYACDDGLYSYARLFGYEKEPPKAPDVTTASGYIKQSMLDNQFPYLTTSYPDVYYASAEQASEITRLLTVLEPYVKENVAKFIAGERSLSEVNDFKAELKNLGIEDLLNIYKEIAK